MAVWLYVRAGASRSTSNAVLRAVRYLIATVFVLIGDALLSYNININFPPIDIPRDVRSAYKLWFTEPKFKRTMCCPKCFHLYDGDPGLIPDTCNWKASKFQRQPCGADLWTRRRTRKGMKKIPKCLYTTQNFNEWLKFFLSRKVIDDALQETFRKNEANGNVLPHQMQDVHDSPAWHNIFGSGRGGAYNLAFGLYIDWFRAFKLKIAGECMLLENTARKTRNNLTFRQAVLVRSHSTVLSQSPSPPQIRARKYLHCFNDTAAEGP